MQGISLRVLWHLEIQSPLLFLTWIDYNFTFCLILSHENLLLPISTLHVKRKIHKGNEKQQCLGYFNWIECYNEQTASILHDCSWVINFLAVHTVRNIWYSSDLKKKKSSIKLFLPFCVYMWTLYPKFSHLIYTHR